MLDVIAAWHSGRAGTLAAEPTARTSQAGVDDGLVRLIGENADPEETLAAIQRIRRGRMASANRARILQLYREGLMFRVIADRLGLESIRTAQNVVYWARKHRRVGYSPRIPRRRF
jgi:hypothetical protein